MGSYCVTKGTAHGTGLKEWALPVENAHATSARFRVSVMNELPQRWNSSLKDPAHCLTTLLDNNCTCKLLTPFFQLNLSIKAEAHKKYKTTTAPSPPPPKYFSDTICQSPTPQPHALVKPKVSAALQFTEWMTRADLHLRWRYWGVGTWCRGSTDARCRHWNTTGAASWSCVWTGPTPRLCGPPTCRLVHSGLQTWQIF